jgi:hypothetical protein
MFKIAIKINNESGIICYGETEWYHLVILGVLKKSSNFAVKCELGRQLVLNFITILALKYFNRLKKTSL